jgi:hypothetical protein
MFAFALALVGGLAVIWKSGSVIYHGLCSPVETRHGNYSPDGQRDADLVVVACTKSGTRTRVRVHGYDDGCEVAEIWRDRPFVARWRGSRLLVVRMGSSEDYRRLASQCGDVRIVFQDLSG